MNKIIAIGRLTRDPEQRTTQSGITTTKFTVACDRRYGSETDFIPVVTFRGLAENFTKTIALFSVLIAPQIGRAHV